MSDIEELDALDPSAKEQVATWWRQDDERLHGIDVIAQAEVAGRYRKDVALIHRIDGSIRWRCHRQVLIGTGLSVRTNR